MDSFLRGRMIAGLDYCWSRKTAGLGLEKIIRSWSRSRWSRLQHWYKSISGIIDSAKQFGVSPTTALSSKSYSHTFWRWLQQHGFPRLFITITADEWKFPKHSFFEDHLQASNSCPGDDAFAETAAIVHTRVE